jgi:hypothetical protein
MFPFVFEWTWDASRLIFMGLLYLVLGVISLGLLYAFVMTWLKLRDSNEKSQGSNVR